MVKYSIEISNTAEKQLRKIPRDDQIRVLRAVKQLAVEPNPSGCRKLSGYDDIFRIRVGVYRILYSVEKKRIVVVILKIGHRKDVYR